MADQTKEMEDALLNARVVFGLEAQGHIPTITKMLEEKRTWDEIGEKIGWIGSTARYYYERWYWEHNPRKEPVSVDALVALAETVGMLEDLSKVVNQDAWRLQPIAQAIFHAKKHLASATTMSVGKK